MRSQSHSGDSAVEFGILGPLRVVVDGREVDVGSAKQRRLLSALLVDVGSVVSTDRLAEILWGDGQPHDPTGSIQTHVSRLRRLLQQAGGGALRDLLVTQPPGYLLVLDPDQVDAGRFQRLVNEARTAPSPRATAEQVGRGLELWRGRPLAEFDHELARAEAMRLQELRAAAIELRAAAMLALGRYSEIAAELEPAVASNPLRERLRGQLMVALYHCGRQAEALAAYRELRDELVGELGVEPSVDLRRLERAILQQEDVLPWPAGQAEESVGIPEASRRPKEVSAPLATEELTSFVGREEEVRELAVTLRERRLVTLTGVGGVGKSRLAVRVARQVADEYRNGARLCELVGADDPEAVADVVATALGVPPGEGASTEDALMEFLRAQELLLILDNCEHVLAGASGLAERVRRHCPDVDVLATSRKPLQARGEHLRRVQPLEVGGAGEGAAVELFCDRAAAAEPSFEPAEADLEIVAEVCRGLDGLPLAVELAATRVRAMTPADIAERIDQRFHLLTEGPRTVAPRHRSLEAVVDWSYNLLSDPTQRLFDRLAVFVGSFGMDAAEQVCVGDGLAPGEVAGRLSELVDHSLVAVDRSADHARYRMLETLRAYGTAQLEERGELPVWRRRHARYFTCLAEEAAPGLQGPQEARWVRVLDAEFANLRAAQAWARANGEMDLALRLPALLRVYAYYRLHDEVFSWALRALELPGAPDHPTYPAALVAAGVGRMQQGQLERARADGEEVLAAASDQAVELRAVQLLTEISLYRGCLEETDRRGRTLLERARSGGVGYYEALGHLYRVFAATYAGRTEDALARLEEGWQAVETAANPTLRAGFWFLEGEVRLDADPEAALAALQRAVEIARSVDNRFIEGVARVAVASLEARHGEPDEALAAFREIVDHWRTAGDWAHMWTTLHNLLVLLERVGADEPAAVLHGAVETAATGGRAFGEDAERLQAAVSSLRMSLDEKVFAAAEARGRDMSDDEAVTYALDEIDRLLAGEPMNAS